MTSKSNNKVVQNSDEFGTRVLVLAPSGRDAAMACELLAQGGIDATPCHDVKELCRELQNGAGTVLLADETLSEPAVHDLLAALAEQETWSDIPLIVFPQDGDNAAAVLEKLGTGANVMLLERPVRIAILLNAVRSALRARRRQYETRKLLESTRRLLREVAEADRQKDLFLATLSHELRTPLTAIIGWIRVLQSGTADEKMTKTALEVISRNAAAQIRLITDILSVSQMVAGTLTIDMQPVELDVLVQIAVDSLRPEAEGRGIEIQSTLEQGSTVVGDADRLQQVVSNLLNNAIRFTPKGGRVTVSLERQRESIQIVVRDNGRGISPKFLPYVFDRFRQEDSSTTRIRGGLGLGLAIVKHLVELHGGSATAESEGEDRGSTFRVELPLIAVSREQSVVSATRNSSRTLEGVRLLVVDDNEDTLTMLKTVLSLEGARVMAADSVATTLNILKTFEPDVLITDLSMPEQDGYDLIENVMALRQGLPAIPAIALTGLASQQDREQARAAGFYAHVSKPVDPDDLVRSIQRALSRSKEA